MNKLHRPFVFLFVFTFAVIVASKNSSTFAHHGREGYYCGVGNGHQGDRDSYEVAGGACEGGSCCDHAPYEPGNDHDYTCVQTGGGFGDGRYCSSGSGPPPNTPIPPQPPTVTPIVPTPTPASYTIQFLGVKLGKVSTPTIAGYKLPTCPLNIGLFNFRILLPCIIPWKK